MSELTLRPLTPTDRPWVTQRIIKSWGAETAVAHGEIFHPADLPGFAAESEGQAVGLLTYHIEGKACEIVTLDSWCEGMGVGSALIETMKQAAHQEGCQRLWLVTTNDNTHALRFYQKRGFSLCALRVNALAESRKLKSEIPFTSEDGIPIRDELELEMRL
ncbi:MAG: GNAT family N-acetyltransferase [Chloroflexota bacterium]